MRLCWTAQPLAVLLLCIALAAAAAALQQPQYRGAFGGGSTWQQCNQLTGVSGAHQLTRLGGAVS